MPPDSFSVPGEPASSTRADDQASARAQLIDEGRAEQIRTLYRQAPGNYLVSLVAGTVVVMILRGHVPAHQLWGWYTALVLLTLIRFALLARYRHIRPALANPRSWGYAYILTSFVAGSLWGASALLLTPSTTMAMQAFVFVVIAGMMAGASLSLNVYLPAYSAFVLPIAVLVAGRMLASASLDTDYGYAMGGLAVLLTFWVAITYYFARTANAAYIRALRLDRENRKLDRTLSSRVAEIESSNRSLTAQVALREQAEAKLREAKERLDLALEASKLSIWDWSEQRKAVYLDATWAAMLGHPSKARLCTVEDLAALVHPDDLLRTRAAQIACLKGATDDYAIEHRVRAEDGSWLWIMSRGRVVERDAKGRALRMIGTNLDISERRRAQEEIEALNRTLRGNLEHLAVANRDLEDFASTASHDLQAPLRRIDSFARLLEAHRAPQLDPEERHWLARVRANTARMSELIDDLLTFARSTHTDIQRADTDLNALLRDIVDDVRDSTGARTVQWHIDNLPAAFCDPAMLRVVLANLISNALKFTRMQHVAVIEVGTLAAGDQEHIIFVRDNGVGFDIKLGKDMFSAFTRLHPDTEFEGTGIGLATVKRIIERHGGRVWAESKAGEGATFFVALPRRN